MLTINKRVLRQQHLTGKNRLDDETRVLLLYEWTVSYHSGKFTMLTLNHKRKLTEIAPIKRHKLI